MKILRCCVLVLASSSVAHAQDRVIGLLTLPEVFGAGPAGPCDRFTPTDVPLYAEPEGKDVLWVDIELMSGSPCQAAGDPTVVARGWLPAHATSGEPTIWFHSRGC